MRGDPFDFWDSEKGAAWAGRRTGDTHRGEWLVDTGRSGCRAEFRGRAPCPATRGVGPDRWRRANPMWQNLSCGRNLGLPGSPTLPPGQVRPPTIVLVPG